MKWIKKGLIYKPDGNLWWAKTHAAIPTPVILDRNTIRIYFASRDKNNVSRIGYIDVDAHDPSVILEVSKEPVLDIGIRGAFDDNGVLPSSIIKYDNKLFMYYFGFQLGVKIRYFMFSGIAESTDYGTAFTRYSNTPVLDRSNESLFLRSAPFVCQDKRRLKMWYVSGNRWITVNNKEVPTYSIKYLESNTPTVWKPVGTSVKGIAFRSSDEYGFGRPYVIKRENKYIMFYSIRTKSKGYRIGYAETKDGIHWARKDEEVGMDVSESGWDSEMICFASIIKVQNKIYMFYNGNNYGETGIGYAVLEKW